MIDPTFTRNTGHAGEGAEKGHAVAAISDGEIFYSHRPITRSIRDRILFYKEIGYGKRLRRALQQDLNVHDWPVIWPYMILEYELKSTQTEQEYTQLDAEIINDPGREPGPGSQSTDDELGFQIEAPCRHWVMRAKWEHIASPSPAELGFQFGLGKVLPKITDPKSAYSLIMPAPENFKRMLKKHGLCWFRHLGLRIFVIYEDGEVDEYDPPLASFFVDALQS